MSNRRDGSRYREESAVTNSLGVDVVGGSGNGCCCIVWCVAVAGTARGIPSLQAIGAQITGA